MANACAHIVCAHIDSSENTPAERFRANVVITHTDGHHVCSGVIVDEHWLLTTAHAIEQYNETDIEISHGLNIDNKLIAVERIEIHPKYEKNRLIHNIALIKVKSKFRHSEMSNLPTMETVEDDLAYAIGVERPIEMVS